MLVLGTKTEENRTVAMDEVSYLQKSQLCKFSCERIFEYYTDQMKRGIFDQV